MISHPLAPLQVPYGGSFFQDIQFLGTAAPGADSCHLRITAEVKFLKRVLGIGGVIRSSASQVRRCSGSKQLKQGCEAWLLQRIKMRADFKHVWTEHGLHCMVMVRVCRQLLSLRGAA